MGVRNNCCNPILQAQKTIFMELFQSFLKDILMDIGAIIKMSKNINLNNMTYGEYFKKTRRNEKRQFEEKSLTPIYFLLNN